MIIGLGTDIIEIDRLEKSLDRSGESFLNHVYTQGELDVCPEAPVRRREFLAGRWAAKEACAKALGTGIGVNCSMQDVEILPGDNGRPVLTMLGNARQTADNLGVTACHLSISHERNYACATVILEGEKLLPQELRAENEALAAAIGKLLLSRGLHLGTAESCTGGLIAATITAIPGSSEWFDGGLVTYTNDWKHRLLGVRQETLENHGAVSEETVREMLQGLRDRHGLTAGLAVSGIAGPGGGTPLKPVGTVCCGAFCQDKITVVTCHFHGDRALVRLQSARRCLQLLQKLLDD